MFDENIIHNLLNQVEQINPRNISDYKKIGELATKLRPFADTVIDVIRPRLLGLAKPWHELTPDEEVLCQSYISVLIDLQTGSACQTLLEVKVQFDESVSLCDELDEGIAYLITLPILPPDALTLELTSAAFRAKIRGNVNAMVGICIELSAMPSYGHPSVQVLENVRSLLVDDDTLICMLQPLILHIAEKTQLPEFEAFGSKASELCK
ncbi:MAG: hypothetical protein AAFR81_20380 [Chloroflexota bacterium]